MSKGAWAATAATAEVIAEDQTRESLTVQLTTAASSPTNLAFGVDAVFGQGVQLVNIGDSVTVRGHLAKLSCDAICNSGLTSGGGYQTDT